MTLTVLTHPDAAEELDAAIDWYDQGGQGRGVEFHAAYNAVIDRCLTWPEAGALYPLDDEGVAVRSAKVAKTSYRIVYFIDGASLWVVALAHQRRRPGYWADRITGLPGQG